MNVETDIDPASLRPEERYKFYLNNGEIFTATFQHYNNNLGVQNSGLRLNNISTYPPTTSMSIPVNFVARITQSAVGPNRDTASNINSFLGGKRKRQTRKRKRESNKNKNKKSKRYRRR